MPTAVIKMGRRKCFLTYTDDFKPGDLPPKDDDYLNWSAWAEVQYKAGIRQKECGKCGKWKTPQEMSDQTVTRRYSRTKRGPANVEITKPVCSQCAITVEVAKP